MGAETDDELLDVLTAEGVPTGRSKRRREVHRDGDWHRSFHLWVMKENRYVLLQRRAQSKDLEAGKLDVTVGGHFAAGESLPEVLRECREEIGLEVGMKDLHYLETRNVVRSYPDATDREIQEVYVARSELELEDYTLDCREVYTLYEVPLERAIALYRDGNYVAAAGYDCQRRRNNALLVEADLIEQARQDVAETLEKIGAWLRSGAGA